MEQRSWVSSVIILLISVGLLAAESDNKAFSLSLQEAVRYAIENNREVLQARLELAKADTNLMKYEAKYSWRAVSRAEYDQKKFPFNQNNIFTGTKIQTNTYSAGIEKSSPRELILKWKPNPNDLTQTLLGIQTKLRQDLRLSDYLLSLQIVFLSPSPKTF